MTHPRPLAPSHPDLPPLEIRSLGQVPYQRSWQAMQAFTDSRNETTADQLWVLEHPPVFTQGQAGRAEHVLAPGNIPVIQADRGGQVTYHGPGQLVVYPLLDIRRLGLGVRELVTLIEDAIIDTLAFFNVSGARLAGAPGVYVDGAKMAALGLRVRKGCSFHGLAFNVDLDLEPFTRINPCGYQGLEVTRLVDHAEATPAQLEQQLVRSLCRHLGYNDRLSYVRGLPEPTDG